MASYAFVSTSLESLLEGDLEVEEQIDVDFWLKDPSDYSSEKLLLPTSSCLSMDFTSLKTEASDPQSDLDYEEFEQEKMTIDTEGSILGEDDKKEDEGNESNDLMRKIWEASMAYLNKVSSIMKTQETQSRFPSASSNVNPACKAIEGEKWLSSVLTRVGQQLDRTKLRTFDICEEKTSRRPPKHCRRIHDKRGHLTSSDPTDSEFISVSLEQLCPELVSEKKKCRRGRKPTKNVCFKCKSVFPYKKNLITHLKSAHQIEKCQSLIYKRINQGAKVMKKLLEQGDC